MVTGCSLIRVLMPALRLLLEIKYGCEIDLMLVLNFHVQMTCMKTLIMFSLDTEKPENWEINR